VRDLRWIAAIAAVALGSAAASAEDVPLWRTVKGGYSEHRLLVDPQIVGDPQLAFLLEQDLKSAEEEARDWEQFAKDEKKQAEASGTTIRENGNDNELTLRLLGATDRYAAILSAFAECYVNCHSAEFVTIYRLPGQQQLKATEVLSFDGQLALLNRLVERDDKLEIGSYPFKCGRSRDADQPDCVSLGDALEEIIAVNSADADERRFKTPGDIENFSKNTQIGFTTDDGGHVKTIDIYFSHSRGRKTFAQAYKWPIDAKVLAPLLKPEIRDLVSSSGASAK
jgi:hypothetical protein